MEIYETITSYIALSAVTAAGIYLAAVLILWVAAGVGNFSYETYLKYFKNTKEEMYGEFTNNFQKLWCVIVTLIIIRYTASTIIEEMANKGETK